VTITDGSHISIDGARIVGCDTLNLTVVTVGAATDAPHFSISNCRIEEIGNTGGIRYGISWNKCSHGSSKNNTFVEHSGATTARGHQFTANSASIVLDNDDLSGLTTATKIAVAGANIWAKSCKGYVTQGSGTSSIASGATSSGNIAHGLAVTPTAQMIYFTPTATTTNDVGGWPWVNTIGATNFKVDCRADPGASGLAFGWSINAAQLA
jgi:hypothetical protein